MFLFKKLFSKKEKAQEQPEYRSIPYCSGELAISPELAMEDFREIFPYVDKEKEMMGLLKYLIKNAAANHYRVYVKTTDKRISRLLDPGKTAGVFETAPTDISLYKNKRYIKRAMVDFHKKQKKIFM